MDNLAFYNASDYASVERFKTYASYLLNKNTINNLILKETVSMTNVTDTSTLTYGITYPPLHKYGWININGNTEIRIPLRKIKGATKLSMTFDNSPVYTIPYKIELWKNDTLYKSINNININNKTVLQTIEFSELSLRDLTSSLLIKTYQDKYTSRICNLAMDGVLIEDTGETVVRRML